ncbi:MAG: WYL domain-containing protein [Nanoarchaeota archaeon]
MAVYDINLFTPIQKFLINYYSLSSDESTTRIVDIYQMHKDCIVAFCNLREDERTFVIDRINAAALLDDKYSIPKGWEPESIILDK